MKHDRSKFTALPLSRFGLMQITRQRVRPEMNIKTTEICPSCGGSGKIAPSILIADQVEKDLDFLLSKQNEKQITISLHPYLFAYFTKGIFSKRMQWMLNYKKKIYLIQDSSLAITDYLFTNKLGEQIEI